MDAARCAKRLGAERVMIVYRRSEAEMPARLEEIHHAKEEGIIFQMLTNPCEILADEKGFAKQMVCDVMVLGEPDASGRRSPEPSGEKITLDVDCVIVAVGTSPNPLIRMTTPGLETDRRGCIVTADGVTSSRPGVFAGGDAVTGAATVILAMGAGKKAADAIDAYIQNK
jgi:glutamate synthase (NADPH/NADH) small chain